MRKARLSALSRVPISFTMTVTRRGFVTGVTASLALARAGLARPKVPEKPPQGPLPGSPKRGELKLPAGAAMANRRLGRPGASVSLAGLGGYHLGMPKEDKEAIGIIHAAIDHGVTFLDNCWDYNDGLSETRMGQGLANGYRKRVFLMTKLDGRTRTAAAEQLEQSLRRLRTDMIDLVQIHEVIRMTDAERVFGPGGCMEALTEAKRAAKLRFIGFTGHKNPALHLHMLHTAFDHRFTFHTVQMPLHVMDPHYKSLEKQVLTVLLQHD